MARKPEEWHPDLGAWSRRKHALFNTEMDPWNRGVFIYKIITNNLANFGTTDGKDARFVYHGYRPYGFEYRIAPETDYARMAVATFDTANDHAEFLVALQTDNMSTQPLYAALYYGNAAATPLTDTPEDITSYLTIHPDHTVEGITFMMRSFCWAPFFERGRMSPSAEDAPGREAFSFRTVAVNGEDAIVFTPLDLTQENTPLKGSPGPVYDAIYLWAWNLEPCSNDWYRARSPDGETPPFTQWKVTINFYDLDLSKHWLGLGILEGGFRSWGHHKTFFAGGLVGRKPASWVYGGWAHGGLPSCGLFGTRFGFLEGLASGTPRLPFIRQEIKGAELPEGVPLTGSITLTWSLSHHYWTRHNREVCIRIAVEVNAQDAALNTYTAKIVGDALPYREAQVNPPVAVGLLFASEDGSSIKTAYPEITILGMPLYFKNIVEEARETTAVQKLTLKSTEERIEPGAEVPTPDELVEAVLLFQKRWKTWGMDPLPGTPSEVGDRVPELSSLLTKSIGQIPVQSGSGAKFPLLQFRAELSSWPLNVVGRKIFHHARFIRAKSGALLQQIIKTSPPTTQFQPVHAFLLRKREGDI